MILAGGKGTRFSEMTDKLPKPMIRAGSKPILIHIINLYITYNVKNIIVLAGYKKNVISNYFSQILSQSSKEKDLYQLDDISIKVIDTGLETMTGGRVKRGIEYLNSEEDFFLTYGDALSDVNLKSLEEFHSKNKPIVSITAVRPPARFGSLELKNNVVEKNVTNCPTFIDCSNTHLRPNRVLNSAGNTNGCVNVQFNTLNWHERKHLKTQADICDAANTRAVTRRVDCTNTQNL